MKRTYTLPGKLGDALLQYPVAFQRWKQDGQTFDLWLDEHTLKPLVPLFESQPCVDEVKLIPGIEHWGMGGQPWDFKLKTEDHLEREIVHLGMRAFPTRQITLECAEHLPFKVDMRKLCAEACFDFSVPGLLANGGDVIPAPRDRVVLHGTFQSHTAGTPGFWRFLAQTKEWLNGNFAEIVWVGTKSERERESELYPEWPDFDDGGDFLQLARLLAGSRLVIGSGSSVVALAGVMKIPCLRVHDPIGDHPKVIWSNLGAHQANFTELELRKGEWARFRDALPQAKVPA